MTFLEEVMGLSAEAAAEVYDDMNGNIANTEQDLAYAQSVSETAANPDSVYTLYLLLCYQIRRECAARGEAFDSEKFYNSFAGNLEHPAYVALSEEVVDL